MHPSWLFSYEIFLADHNLQNIWHDPPKTEKLKLEIDLDHKSTIQQLMQHGRYKQIPHEGKKKGQILTQLEQATGKKTKQKELLQVTAM